MKKFMALSMAAIMALTVAGCGSKPAETTAAGTTAAETAANADTTAAESAAEEETSAAASGKKYIINTDTTFAPFEFENEKGEMVGIDLDILQAIAQDQGFEYEVVPVGFSAAVTALEAGECEGCTFAESIAEQYGFEVIQYESSSDMYQAVIAGEAVACFEDYPVIGYEISRGLGLTLPTPMEKGSSYGFATLKGANPELVEMFNKGLENIKASGRYDEILNTYIAK